MNFKKNSNTMMNNKYSLTSGSYIKNVFKFHKLKRKTYLCFSILHDQTTAKARSKLVG